jgi:hypothetical protein
VPLALVVLLAGAGAIRLGRAATTSREVRGRMTGLALLLVAAGGCAYWVMFGRYLEVLAAPENRAVAAALDPSVPYVVVGSSRADGLNPDDFYEGAPLPLFARTPADLGALASMKSLQLIAFDEDRAAIEARLGPTRALLAWPSSRGRTLFVLRRDR